MEKKYGVYADYSGNKSGAYLIREYSVLKDAVREAFRLSRCRYMHNAPQQANIFIVGNYTGMTLNSSAGEIVRYTVLKYKHVGGIVIYGGVGRVKKLYIIKENMR